MTLTIQSKRKAGSALLLCSVISLSAVAEFLDPTEGGNRIPDTYLILSKPVSAVGGSAVAVSYWDEECVEESCRQQGLVTSETVVRAAGGTVDSVSSLGAYEKHKIVGVVCGGPACKSISAIELAN